MGMDKRKQSWPILSFYPSVSKYKMRKIIKVLKQLVTCLEFKPDTNQMQVILAQEPKLIILGHKTKTNSRNENVNMKKIF
jgi:hypothetical protein